jgi:hypothetical protein
MQAVERAQRLDRLRRRLTEVRARIEDQLLQGDAALERQRDPFAQKQLDIGSDPPVQRLIEQLLLGRRARVHHDQPRAGLRTHVRERRIQQTADVVDDRSTGFDRRQRDLGLVGVDGHDRVQLPSGALDHRDNPLDLLLGRDRRTVGDPGFTTDVDQIGAFGQQRLCARNALLERLSLAGVGERVRRRVDDPHQPRPASKRERSAGRSQRTGGRGHHAPIPSARASSVNASTSAWTRR